LDRQQVLLPDATSLDFCVPDEWEAFYFWKELLAPDWFRNLYNTHSKAVAGWLSNKPTLQKLVAKWMRAKISEVTHG